MKSISTFPAFSIVTVSFAGMALFAVIDQVEAGKGITASGSRTYSVGPIVRGGVSKPPTTGTAKANPPRIVREHGDEKVFAPPGRVWCHHPVPDCHRRTGKVRDHRKHPASAHLPPRVVPKEDPPQKW
jgi:hypothetical protein